MTIICGQCDNATLTELALGSTYAADRNDRNMISFLNRLRVICYENDDGGLSHKPYKIAIAVKPLHNYTNLKPGNPHGLIEELKVKYEATLAIVGKFPNRTALME